MAKNFTATMPSIMGIQGQTLDSAGGDMVVIELTPNDGYLIVAEELSILNSQDFETATITQSGDKVNINIDTLDDDLFNGTNQSRNVSVGGDARPINVRVNADISFENDSCISYMVRTADGDVIPSNILPVNVTGVHNTDASTAEVVYIGSVDVNPAIGKQFTTTEIAEGLFPLDTTDNAPVFILEEPAENEFGGINYTIGVIFPKNHENFEDIIIEGTEIGFTCEDSEDTPRVCEVRTLDIDTGSMSPTEGAITTITAIGDPGASGTLTFTATPTFLGPSVYSFNNVTLATGTNGRLQFSSNQALYQFIDALGWPHSSTADTTVQYDIEDQFVFEINGNRHTLTQRDGADVEYDDHADSSSGNTYIDFISGTTLFPPAAGQSGLLTIEVDSIPQNVVINPDTVIVDIFIGDSGKFSEIITLPGYTGEDEDGVPCAISIPPTVGILWNSTFVPGPDCELVGMKPDPVDNSEGTTVCFRVATGSTFMGGFVSLEEFVSNQGTISTFTLQGAPDVIEVRFGDDNLAMGSEFTVSGNVVTLSPPLDSNAKTIAFDYVYSEEISSGFDDILIGPGQPGASFNPNTNTHTFTAPVGQPWDIIGADGNPITVDSDGTTVTTTNDIFYSIPDINDSVSIIEGSDTGAILCDGEIRRSNNGLTLTVKYRYTEGSYQNQNTKYLVNLDNLAGEVGNTAVNIEFVDGDNYNFSPNTVSYTGEASSAIPSDGGFIPTSVILTADPGYSWNIANISDASILTQFTLADFVGVNVVDSLSFTLINGTSITAALLASNTPISTIVARWSFDGSFPAAGSIDIVVNPSLMPTKLVTTSFNTGANDQGQATLSRSRFTPLSGITGLAGTPYTTEVFINSDDGFVFNQTNFPTVEIHSSTTATASVGDTLPHGTPEEINDIPRHRELRAVITGTHGQEDETVFIDANGKGLRMVDLTYSVNNNHSASLSVGDFITTIKSVEGDAPIVRNLVLSPIGDNLFTSTSAPLVIQSDIQLPTFFTHTRTVGSNTDAQPDVEYGTHTSIIHILDPSGNPVTEIPDSNTFVNIVIEGDPPIPLPSVLDVCLDFSGSVAIDSESVELGVQGGVAGYINPQGVISFSGYPQEYVDLILSFDSATGYTFNNANDITLDYPNEITQTSAFVQGGRWHANVRITMPTGVAPGATVSSNKCITVDVSTSMVTSDVSLRVYQHGTTTPVSTPHTLSSLGNSFIPIDVVYDGAGLTPAGWSSSNSNPANFFVTPSSGADGTTMGYIGAINNNTSVLNTNNATISFFSNAAGIDVSSSITVVQERSIPTISTNTQEVAIPHGIGQTAQITVDSNHTWEVLNLNSSQFSVSPSLTNGVSDTQTSQTITITSIANNNAQSDLINDIQVRTTGIEGQPTAIQTVRLRQEPSPATFTLNFDTSLLDDDATFNTTPIVITGVTGTSLSGSRSATTQTGMKVDLVASIALNSGAVGVSLLPNPSSNTIQWSGVMPVGGGSQTISLSGLVVPDGTPPDIVVGSAENVVVSTTTATIPYSVIGTGGQPITLHQLLVSPAGGGSIASPSGTKHDLNKAVLGTAESFGYTIELSGLLPGTRYSYDTLATNIIGSSYGGGVYSFMTEAVPEPDPMYTVTLDVDSSIDPSSAVTVYGDGSTAMGFEGDAWTLTTQIQLTSNEYVYSVSPSLEITSGSGTLNPSSTIGTQTISGTFGSSDETISVQWNGVVQVSEDTQEVIPAFELLNVSSTPPLQSGEDSSIEVSWTDDYYTGFTVQFLDPTTRETLSNFSIIGTFDTGIDYGQETLNIPSNESIETLGIVVFIRILVPNLPQTYSNAGEFLTTEFQWMQPGIEPVDTPEPEEITDVTLYVEDQVTGGNISATVIQNVQEGGNHSFLITSEEGYRSPTLEEINNGAVRIISNDGFSELSVIEITKLYNSVIVEISLNDEVDFQQDSYTLIIQGAFILGEELGENTSATVSVEGTISNAAIVGESSQTILPNGEGIIFQFQPKDGYEFTSNTDVSFDVSQFSDDDLVSSNIYIGTNGIEEGNLGIVLVPRNTIGFSSDSYTIYVSGNAETVAPVEPVHVDTITLTDTNPTKTTFDIGESIDVDVSFDVEPRPASVSVRFRVLEGPHTFSGFVGLSADKQTLTRTSSVLSADTVHVPLLRNNSPGSSEPSTIEVVAWADDADGNRVISQTIEKTFLGDPVVEPDIGLTSLTLTPSSPEWQIGVTQGISWTATPNSDLEVVPQIYTLTLEVTEGDSTFTLPSFADGTLSNGVFTIDVTSFSTGVRTLWNSLLINPSEGEYTATVTGTDVNGLEISDSVVVPIIPQKHTLSTRYTLNLFADQSATLSSNPDFRKSLFVQEMDENTSNQNVYSIIPDSGEPVFDNLSNQYKVQTDTVVADDYSLVPTLSQGQINLAVNVGELDKNESTGLLSIKTPSANIKMLDSGGATMYDHSFSKSLIKIRPGQQDTVRVSRTPDPFNNVGELDFRTHNIFPEDSLTITKTISNGIIFAQIAWDNIPSSFADFNDMDGSLYAEEVLPLSVVLNNITGGLFTGSGTSTRSVNINFTVSDGNFGLSQASTGTVYWKQGNSVSVSDHDGTFSIINKTNGINVLSSQGSFNRGTTYTFGLVMTDADETTDLSNTITYLIP